MEEAIENKPNSEQQLDANFKYLPFFNKTQPVIILILLGFIFYINSINNESALDDGIAIHQNEFVLKGATQIKNIFTHDDYYFFYKRMNASDQLFGGRYRPLGTASYAIEQEFIGTYRTGFYYFCQDLNNNGIVDDKQIDYTSEIGKNETNFECNELRTKYENRKVKGAECLNCWDLNKNGNNDFEEDLNHDGVFNEVDCQVKGAGLRHLNNVIIYILCCLAFYTLLKKFIFKTNPDFAFVTALLFLIHPVHTEVVAYVFGRHHLLCFLFSCYTLIYCLKYASNKSFFNIFISALSFLLALFSGEFSFLLFILIPLTLYVFADNKKTLLLYLILISVFAFYLFMRVNSVYMGAGRLDTEPLNNPYAFATGEEKFATKIYMLLYYLKQSIFPYPLISDYSFDSISYRNFASWDFWLSVIINLSLLFYAVAQTIKKNVLGYGLLVYFISIIPCCQLLFPTSVVFIESFLFHASIGVCIVLTILLFKLLEILKTPEKKYRTVLLTSFIVLIVVSLIVVVNRNADWKNDVTLFFKDVKKQPRSVLILGNAGARWIDLADTREITGVAIPGGDTAVFNDYNGTLTISDEDMKLFNAKTKREAALKKGINFLDTAVKLHPQYVNGFLNLGLAHFKLYSDEQCILNWKRAEKLYPDNPYLQSYYSVYQKVLSEKYNAARTKNEFENAEKYLLYLHFVNPKNEEGLENLCQLYFDIKHYEACKNRLKELLKLDPKNNIGNELTVKLKELAGK